MNITHSTIFKFVELANARGFVEHATKIMLIVMGDDMRFWVVTPADATRLQRAGYEIAG